MTPPSDATLMTLAGIAYGDPARLEGYLAAAVPTAGWRVVWKPAVGEAPDNFLFLASDGVGSYVIAIRGTYPDPFSEAYWDDGNQDSPFSEMVDWPDAPGAKIGGGTHAALSNLQALEDVEGRTLASVVAGLAPSAVLTVTGHSLGGTLAPVLAQALAEADRTRDLHAVSFAGMTPGNAAFATHVSEGSLGERVRRVYNTLDTVSFGWDRVWATHDFYQPAPRGGDVVAALLLATEARLKFGGYGYAPVGTPVPLQGTVRPPTVPCTLVAYVLENLYQHLPDTYLSLLGAPPLPFSILWGAMTVPRAHVQADRAPSPAGPVLHFPG